MSDKSTQELVQNGLASLAIEGIHPTEEMQADLDLLMANKITTDEFYIRALK